MFVPRRNVVRRPQGSIHNIIPVPHNANPGPSAQLPVTQIIIDSIMIPVSRDIPLATIAGGSPGIPGVLYTADYFLVHDGPFAPKALLLSAAKNVDQPGMQAQILQQADGRVLFLSPNVSIPYIGPTPVEIPFAADPDGGTIYVRIRALYQSTVLHATLELLTSKVP